MESDKRRVTSTDVARVSGVSRATVSYVLNNDPRQSIPPGTRERVLMVAKELGYRPFTAARILRAGYSRIVLVVLPFELVDPAIARSLKELEGELAAHGFSLIWYVGLHTTMGHIHPSANLTPAVIVSYTDETDLAIEAFLQQFNVPILSMSNETSRQTIGRAQVSYLFERGQSRIVFAAPERQDVQWLAQARLDGVRQRCAEYALDPPFVQVIPSSREGAREAITHLLAQQSPPFGVCCYNDEVAFAVLAAFSDVGVQVPESVLVIGCDDIPLAQFSIPPLTTISFDNSQWRDLLVENILAASRGDPTREVFPSPYLVIVRVSA
ncbi:MAG TPA: LacI family DNA-binding transcriptional regulator [Ktedonobacteraceae bacterium]|nr:LacI family DNA-binding transcriptional regulator [Ktedonobacteraceae bacterium]